MSDDTKVKCPPPIPIRPRPPKDAVVKRKKKERSGELLSVSEWALRKLEDRYGHEALVPTVPEPDHEGDDGE